MRNTNQTQEARTTFIDRMVKQHGPLFARCFRAYTAAEWFPGPSAVPSVVRRWVRTCTPPWKAAQRVATPKMLPDIGDWLHIWDVVIVGIISTLVALLGQDCRWSFRLAALLAVWRLSIIVRDDFALLWFDDLLAALHAVDPQVHSFRRLSLHVLLQLIEVVLLFAVLYRWWQPTTVFREFFFASFQATMTLNYEDKLTPNRYLWMLQTFISVLIVVVVFAVVAGERHTRTEITSDPCQEWRQKGGEPC